MKSATIFVRIAARPVPLRLVLCAGIAERKQDKREQRIRAEKMFENIARSGARGQLGEVDGAAPLGHGLRRLWMPGERYWRSKYKNRPFKIAAKRRR